MTKPDVQLIMEALRWTWQGDPDLVTEEHWEAYTRLAKELGLEEDE